MFEKVLWGLLVFVTAFIPLYPKFPLMKVSGTFVAVRIEDLFVAALLGGWLIFLWQKGKLEEIFKDRLNQLLLLFFFIGAVSSFSAVFLTHTAPLNLAAMHFLRRVEFMTLLPVARFLINSRKRLAVFLGTLAGVTILVNIYALGQQYFSWPVISTGNSEFSKGQILRLTDGARVNSTFAGHYDLAVFLVMILVLSVPLFFSYKKLWFKAGSLFLFSLSFLILVMTAARLSFVAAVAGIGAALLFSGKRLLIIVLLVLTAGALIYPSQLRDRFISTVTINIKNAGDRYAGSTPRQREESRLNIPTLSRGVPDASKKADLPATASAVSSDITPGEPVDTTELGVYRSLQIRLNQEWPRAIRGFVKNPLLGTGYSSLGLATDNDFLRSLGEVGILGTISFLLILLEVTRRVWRNYLSSDKFIKLFSAGVLSMIFAFLLNSLFIDVFEASKVAAMFWIVAGAGLGVVKR